MTTTREKHHVTTRASGTLAVASAVSSVGAPAAILACVWMCAVDCSAEAQYVWIAVAGALAVLLLTRPIVRFGLVSRACIALAQAAATLLALCTGAWALAAWEESCPRLPAAATVASSVLNLVGFDTAAERGLLLLEHPDGLVTMVPSTEKLALHPFLIFWLAWTTLRLARGYGRVIVCAIAGLAATLAVSMARYVTLVAVYIEHDNILSGAAGQAALDLFASPWITCFFLLIAGIVVDVGCRLLPDERAAPVPAPPHFGTLLASAASIALIGAPWQT